MKSNECDAFAEEIGAYIGSRVQLGAAAAAHLSKCAKCLEKISELKAVATLQEDVAARMPEPKLRLHRRQLGRLLEKKRDGFGSLSRWIKPAAAFATLVILAGVVALREQRRVPTESTKVESGTEQSPVETTTFAPTISALHQELESGREMLASAPGISRMRHYRVRDVESELNN